MIARLFAAAHLTVHAASGARSQPITYAPPPLPGAPPPVPYPVQRALTGAMRDTGDKSRDVHRMQAWAGQAAALARAEPAGELVLRLWQEVEALLPARRTCGLYLRRVAGLSRGRQGEQGSLQNVVLTGDRGFESVSLQGRDVCEPACWRSWTRRGRVRSILVGYWCAWRHRLGRRRVLVGYRCAWLLQALL